ncbi:TetR/AcrR family transcriptional regulator [Georgenia sp. Z1491]|uniref:TetR/AcrR family transcriptional regulator n=1 Tax=Georgenia sp. Z1491 TaxID=3416707 RepID=UPI003CE961CD
MVQAGTEDVSGAAAPGAAAPRADGRTTEAAPRADGRTTRWDDHRAARRLELVRAARRCVHERGPDVSMDDLAAHMRTSKSILYRYFTDKAGLQRAVGQHVLHRMLRELTEAAARTGGPRERIHSMVAAYLQMVDDAPHVYAFVTSPTGEAAGDVRGFVAEVDVVIARTLVPAVLGLDDDAEVEHVSPEQATRATLWASGVTGTVRSVADRWLAARAELERIGVDASSAAPATSGPDAAAAAGSGVGQDVPDPTTSGPDAAAEVSSGVGGLTHLDLETAVAGVDRDELAAFIASWLWDGAVGVLRRARSDTRPRTVPTTRTDKDVT